MKMVLPEMLEEAMANEASMEQGESKTRTVGGEDPISTDGTTKKTEEEINSTSKKETVDAALPGTEKTIHPTTLAIETTPPTSMNVPKITVEKPKDHKSTEGAVGDAKIESQVQMQQQQQQQQYPSSNDPYKSQMMENARAEKSAALQASLILAKSYADWENQQKAVSWTGQPDRECMRSCPSAPEPQQQFQGSCSRSRTPSPQRRLGCPMASTWQDGRQATRDRSPEGAVRFLQVPTVMPRQQCMNRRAEQDMSGSNYLWNETPPHGMDLDSSFTIADESLFDASLNTGQEQQFRNLREFARHIGLNSTMISEPKEDSFLENTSYTQIARPKCSGKGLPYEATKDARKPMDYRNLPIVIEPSSSPIEPLNRYESYEASNVDYRPMDFMTAPMLYGPNIPLFGSVDQYEATNNAYRPMDYMTAPMLYGPNIPLFGSLDQYDSSKEGAHLSAISNNVNDGYSFHEDGFPNPSPESCMRNRRADGRNNIFTSTLRGASRLANIPNGSGDGRIFQGFNTPDATKRPNVNFSNQNYVQEIVPRRSTLTPEDEYLGDVLNHIIDEGKSSGHQSSDLPFKECDCDSDKPGRSRRIQIFIENATLSFNSDGKNKAGINLNSREPDYQFYW